MLYTKDVRGNDYLEVMRFLLSISDAFLLVYEDYREDNLYPARKQEWQAYLKDDLLRIRHDPVWPSTVQEKSRRPTDICIYRVSVHSAAFILGRTDHLFGWQYPALPEDLSFFANGQCLMGMSAHEGYAFYSDTRDTRKMLAALGINFRVAREPHIDYHESYSLR